MARNNLLNEADVIDWCLQIIHMHNDIWSVLKFVHMCIHILVWRTEQFFSMYRFTYARIQIRSIPSLNKSFLLCHTHDHQIVRMP
jgi:hypothetical protein